MKLTIVRWLVALARPRYVCGDVSLCVGGTGIRCKPLGGEQ